MVKKILKRSCALIGALVVLCCSCFLAPEPASAFSSGTGLPAPGATGQIGIALSLSFKYQESSANTDIKWIADYPVVLQVSDVYNNGFSSNNIVVDGVTVAYIDLRVDGRFVYITFDPVVYAVYDIELSSRYPFIASGYHAVSVFSMSSVSWYATFGYLAVDKVLTDDNYSLSVSTEYNTMDFYNSNVEPVVRYFSDYVPPVSMITYFSIRSSGNSPDDPAGGFILGLPYVSLSDSQTALAYFSEKFEVDLDRNVVEQVTVTEFPTNWADFLVTAASGFFNAEIIPGFTFGGIFAAVIGVLLFMFFIHVFKG